MKTLHLTNTGSTHILNSATQYQAHLLATHPKIPQDVLDQALFDHLTQVALFGFTHAPMPLDREDLGYGFYESSLDRAIEASDPVGTYAVRIDYNPNWTDRVDPGNTEGGEFKCPTDPADLFGNLLMALETPHSYETNPHSTWIDHFRMSAVVRPGVIVTRSLWPVFEANFSEPDVAAEPAHS